MTSRGHHLKLEFPVQPQSTKYHTLSAYNQDQQELLLLQSHASRKVYT